MDPLNSIKHRTSIAKTLHSAAKKFTPGSRFKTWVLNGIILGLFLAPIESPQAVEVRSFNLHTVEISGTKFWLPSTLIVKKGDRVRVRITSKVPGANSVHGFAIDDFNIQEIADPKGKELEFVADKAGIFTIRCHLHPAHVGGQLLVTE